MAQNLYSYPKWTGRLVAILEISIWAFVHSLDKQLKIMLIVHIIFFQGIYLKKKQISWIFAKQVTYAWYYMFNSRDSGNFMRIIKILVIKSLHNNLSST